MTWLPTGPKEVFLDCCEDGEHAGTSWLAVVSSVFWMLTAAWTTCKAATAWASNRVHNTIALANTALAACSPNTRALAALATIALATTLAWCSSPTVQLLHILLVSSYRMTALLAARKARRLTTTTSSTIGQQKERANVNKAHPAVKQESVDRQPTVEEPDTEEEHQHSWALTVVSWPAGFSRWELVLILWRLVAFIMELKESHESLEFGVLQLLSQKKTLERQKETLKDTLARQTDLATSFAGDVQRMTTEARGYRATINTLTQSVARWQLLYREVNGMFLTTQRLFIQLQQQHAELAPLQEQCRQLRERNETLEFANQCMRLQIGQRSAF